MSYPTATMVNDAINKRGDSIPKGTEVTVEPCSPTLKGAILRHGETSIIVAYERLYHYTGEFQEPSLDQIKDMIFDGDCTSVAGEWVEPDGKDEHGFPSWLLVLGMI